jgi:hypothetical protein
VEAVINLSSRRGFLLILRAVRRIRRRDVKLRWHGGFLDLRMVAAEAAQHLSMPLRARNCGGACGCYQMRLRMMMTGMATVVSRPQRARVLGRCAQMLN